MTWKNVFDPTVSQEFIDRVNKLTPETQPQWGKMDVAQMMAHCNVAYDLAYTDKYPKPKGFKKFLIKLFAKGIVTGPKPYKRNMRTAPVFLITDPREFETEKNRLVAHIKKTQELGEAHFDNRDSHAFGKLSVGEWNTLFSKHLEHHLGQFGV